MTTDALIVFEKETGKKVSETVGLRSLNTTNPGIRDLVLDCGRKGQFIRRSTWGDMLEFQLGDLEIEGASYGTAGLFVRKGVKAIFLFEEQVHAHA